MHYELEILESLVFSKLNPSFSSGPSKEMLEEFKTIVRSEKSRIKKSFIKAVFEFREDQLIEFYVHNHQNRLTLLADTLYNYLQQKDPLLKMHHRKNSLLGVQKAVYFSILDLLSFIENRFAKYINPEEKIPEGIKFITINELKNKLAVLHESDNFRSRELLSIVIAPLNEFTENSGKINSARLLYIKELVNVCLKSLKHEKEKDFIICLSKKLVFINFNSVRFFDFVTEQVRLSLDLTDNVNEKIDKLSWYLKELNQTQINSQLCYNRELKSIKELIAEWLIEEISYYEKGVGSYARYKEEDRNQPRQDFKIITDLSVSQLAFLLRLLVDTEIIKSRNDRELIKYIASITQTKKAETISPESLRTKYYNFDENIKEEVKHLIIKILNHIQQM